MNLEFNPTDESRIEHLAKLAYGLRITANPTVSTFVQFALNQAGVIVLEQARLQGVKAKIKQPPAPPVKPVAVIVHPMAPDQAADESILPMRRNDPSTIYH